MSTPAVTVTVAVFVDEKGEPSLDVDITAHPDVPASIVKALAEAGLGRAARELAAMDDAQLEAADDRG
jgi:hypothetical protein